jgi:predicted phage terminase large subunit-like protein
MNESLDIQRAKLLGSFILFTQVFYKLRTGRDFVISQPIARESHHLTIAKSFTSVLRGAISRLIINVEPGSGKSELCKHFVAWALAHYPDSNFLYISYSHELAAKHTYGIKQIISIPEYRRLFGVEISHDSSAKDNFKTTAGGVIYASGSSGSITGQDAGLPHLDRFSGALVMDDMHKPDDVHSDTMRAAVTKNYFSTLIHRKRGANVPFVFIGQRLHEDDLPANLIKGADGYEWDKVILKSIDDTGNVLYPQVHSREFLENMQETAPYEYASQYQQDPQPAGGGIFKPEWFVLTDDDPEMLATFIIGDTAESVKEYADYTAFSFFGIYKLKHKDVDLNLFGLHWINCLEARMEPKDLEAEYMQFWAECMRYPVKPKMSGIETKSTGSTLASVMKATQGMRIIEIDRNVSTGNKATRFLRCQPYVASKQISLPRYGKHTHTCLEHMRKITANDTHRHDDIADTLADGIQLGLIDQSIYSTSEQDTRNNDFVKSLAQNFNRVQDMRRQQWR